VIEVEHIGGQINDTPGDFDYLFRLWERFNAARVEVSFDLTWCRFLRQNAVAFLGGLARLIQHRGGQVHFNWSTRDDAVAMNLAQNGFIAAFGGSRQPWAGNSIPFREDAVQDAHDFRRYLSELWLGRGWVNVSPGLRDAIVGHMVEIYLNAFDHGQSPIGVFTCGQHFPKKQELNLTIVDFGVGIPSNVRLFKSRQYTPAQLSGKTCMEWAFQAGTTTKPGTARGLGLDLLREFVQKNRGRLEMFSHEGYTVIAEGATTHAERKTFFEGTLVNVCLRCDESYYCLASESIKRPPF
jgi:hypothetical protein